MGIRRIEAVKFNQEAPNGVRSTMMPVGRSGLELIYMPRYSPVEKVFLEVKRILGRMGACGKVTLIEAIG